jgi:hypothetical protein
MDTHIHIYTYTHTHIHGSWDKQGKCNINVIYDPSSSELRFKCNGSDVKGVIPKVRGKSLHPAVYSSVKDMSFKVGLCCMCLCMCVCVDM